MFLGWGPGAVVKSLHGLKVWHCSLYETSLELLDSSGCSSSSSSSSPQGPWPGGGGPVIQEGPAHGLPSLTMAHGCWYPIGREHRPATPFLLLFGILPNLLLSLTGPANFPQHSHDTPILFPWTSFIGNLQVLVGKQKASALCEAVPLEAVSSALLRVRFHYLSWLCRGFL